MKNRSPRWVLPLFAVLLVSAPAVRALDKQKTPSVLEALRSLLPAKTADAVAAATPQAGPAGAQTPPRAATGLSPADPLPVYHAARRHGLARPSSWQHFMASAGKSS